VTLRRALGGRAANWLLPKSQFCESQQSPEATAVPSSSQGRRKDGKPLGEFKNKELCVSEIRTRTSNVFDMMYFWIGHRYGVSPMLGQTQFHFHAPKNW